MIVTNPDRVRSFETIQAEAARLLAADPALTNEAAIAKAAARCPDAYAAYRAAVLTDEPPPAVADARRLTNEAAAVAVECIVKRLVPATAALYARADVLVARDPALTREQAVAQATTDHELSERLFAERQAIAKESPRLRAQRKIAERLAALATQAQLDMVQSLVQEDPQMFVDLLSDE